MATIKEIAKACGVSVATVSNILNKKPGASEATRNLVLKTAKEMNYMPNYVAKNLKARNTRSIGVIAEDMTIFSIPDIIDGITEYCEKVKYQILLTNLRLYKKYNDYYYHRTDYYGLVDEEIRKLIATQVDGIIYVTAHERIMHCIPDNLSIPAAMAYGDTKSQKIPPAVITGNADSLHAQARLIGYQKALRDEGLLYDPELIYYGDWGRESGHTGAEVLLKKQVTAIFCMNDLMAGGCYDWADESGIKIPQEISVAGYDNRELSSYYKPPLSTTELPLHDIGYRAAEVMIGLVEKKPGETAEPQVYKVPCKQLIRQSIKTL